MTRCVGGTRPTEPKTGRLRPLLEQAASGNGVSVLLLTDAGHKDQVAEYVAQGNAVQLADPRWAREVRQWIRFNIGPLRRAC